MASKKEILIEKANGLGIELSGKETSLQLQELIESAEGGIEADKEAHEEGEHESVDIILVKDDEAPLVGAIYVRQYSFAVHGENYKDLAAEFCTTKPSGFIKGIYKAVPASQISDVEVRYRESENFGVHPDKQKVNAQILDKVARFGADEKPEAVRLGTQKFDSTVVVSRPKIVSRR